MSEAEYLVPCEDAQSEFVEKRSRFIGHIFRVEDEGQARACIEQVKKKHYDARHNCWCYLLREGGIVRYSDDGEPQGTAGQPMLEVFRREGVLNVCCVVTRYFGGILLGAGGLTRAYAKSAKDALDAAGVSRMRPWTLLRVPCTYPLFERLKLLLAAQGAQIEDTEYGEGITIRAAIPKKNAASFHAQFTELSLGALRAEETGEVFRPGARESAK
ncbi:MAG: YigZ family protein [Oscillospiraceae bacterium]|nr:YigZ family protein [Oscillospiraceae bacterium]